MVTAKVDGRTVKVGEWVGFKCDIEQTGKIVDIQHDSLSDYNGPKLILENEDGFHGEYIGGDTRTYAYANDCW